MNVRLPAVTPREPRTEANARKPRIVSRLLLRVDEGPDAGTIYRSTGEATISVGASPDNQLVLRDRAVSRYHLELRVGKQGILVQDLGSRNGTYLGAVKIERAAVPPQTRLRIGRSVLLIEDADQVAAEGQEEAPRIAGLVGESEPMGEVARLVDRLAGVPSSVLIQGETGVGKEVVAEALHNHGPRAAAPFVVVDCGSMPATLVASQLFGHEKGAFTGADQRRIGAFEQADGGTVLLDEIGELPLEIQPSLLGVLERRRFTRVGGAKEIEVDVRVLAATNRDLRAEVNQGSFRADLYYRLAVARIEIPPLRDRPDDIEPLVRHFAEQITGVPGEMPLADDALDALRAHPWSGNARELRNVVEGALLMGQLELEGAQPQPVVGREEIVQYRKAREQAIRAFEYRYLKNLIEQCEGNASEAARRAKMDRPYLLTLLRRHGLR
jgi:DNA-binding NtrC family response regulator